MPSGYYIRKKRIVFSKKAIENIRKAQIKKWKNIKYRKMMSNAHKGYKMPQSQKEKIRKSHLGKKSCSWKGGKYKNYQGYIMIYQPNHPFAISKRHIPEHRLVIEKYLRRFLKKGEVVHHINGIKDDNRPENLRLFKNQSKHIKFHNT